MIYHNDKKDEEKKYDILLKQMENLNLSTLSNQEITSIADNMFKLFKSSFENHSYDAMEKISKYCKRLTSNYIIKKFSNDVYFLEVVTDIACFVFEQMYMYEEKVNVLTTIIKLDNIDKVILIRAIEELLSPEPEIQQLIFEKVDELKDLLKRLTSA